MADPPPVAASASPQPDQLVAASASTPHNTNPNPLLSPQIPPSPTVSDLSAHISSPQQLDPASAAASGGGSMDFPPRPPQQLQAPSPTQAATGAGGFGQIHRSGSASRLSTASQLPQYAAMAARMYGGQMSFSGGGGQVGQQQQQLIARAAMLGQGHLGMLQGQGNAAHFGLQPQMMVQPRQKGMAQSTQFNTANAAQALQGMQPMGVMGTLGMNQMRPNGTIPYGAQQRFAHAQMRPQQASQQAALSPQKVAGQGLSRTASIAAVNSQLPGSSQNGQMVAMSMPQQQQQQQWLKQMQSSMGSPVSPQLHQQRLMLMQQLQQKTGLSQQQIAQAQQQHPHLSAQQLIQQQQFLQQLQQQQPQQSPRISASGSQKSANLTGSQPGTPLSGGTMTGGSASQGAEGTSQLLGKRKIQDLVAQVDPLGKVDPDVEDLLLEIADDFIDSVSCGSADMGVSLGDCICMHLGKAQEIISCGSQGRVAALRKKLAFVSSWFLKGG
ncbi:transcription initiation factor TFIID subunit 12b-like isoform X2 [Phragmites australis]|uniref:transcription initiation factor TFIID subunit 12b-like isoform X2 n=1 Tax=Phragmites australis TaxID=29695 RepID=UPI002D79D8F0|nr:transcription initiation factor TFIID subunit 12b-like isoform X2 [Phragmites australis]